MKKLIRKSQTTRAEAAIIFFLIFVFYVFRTVFMAVSFSVAGENNRKFHPGLQNVYTPV